jgi:hypothetical protein
MTFSGHQLSRGMMLRDYLTGDLNVGSVNPAAELFPFAPLKRLTRQPQVEESTTPSSSLCNQTIGTIREKAHLTGRLIGSKAAERNTVTPFLAGSRIDLLSGTHAAQ